MKRPSTKTAPSRARRLLKRAGLVLLVAAFGAVLGGGWVYHGARAQVSENLWDLGSQMMRYADASRQDTPRDLVVNGQVLRLSSGTARRSATEVLDFFEGRCAEVDGSLTEQLTEARDRDPSRWEDDRDPSPTMREDNGRAGYVACLDYGQSISVAELGARLHRFGETGDVSDVGQMRFVFVESRETDEGPQTHFVAMWTTGSFDVDRMFPEEGDAPGRDVEGLGRPPRSRRVLSSFERGEPYTLTVYQARGDEAELERFYRRELASSGWTILEPEGGRRGDGPRTFVAEQGERMLTFVFQTDIATGSASAAVIDVR